MNARSPSAATGRHRPSARAASTRLLLAGLVFALARPAGALAQDDAYMGGLRLSEGLRLEAQLSWRDGMEFDGQANFLDVSGKQPVQADARSLGAFLAGYYDLPAIGWLIPYAGAGIGAMRNRLSRTDPAFPGLGPTAVTRAGGGRHTGFAWTATLGAALPLGEALLLDVSWRYSDLGEVRSDTGRAQLIRGTRSLHTDVAETVADLETQGVSVALRYSF